MKELSPEVVYTRRHSNVAGKVILPHHALATLRYPASLLLISIVMAVLADALLWWFLEPIMHFWGAVFGYWIPLIAPQGSQVGFQATSFFGSVVQLPFPLLPAGLPSGRITGVNLIVTSLLLLFSLALPKRVLPLAYYLRALLIIQASASIYFILNPHSFPYNLDSYMVTELGLGVYLMFIVPPVLALLYYPLDFSLWHKLLLTVLIIGFYIVALPFQYLMHAYIISIGTLLFLPTLYLLFGALLDVLMFIALYSWAMTWGSASR